jgi:hypothetical protein
MAVFRLWNLSGRDRRILFEAASLLLLARLGLGMLPHCRVSRILTRVAGWPARARRHEPPSPDRIAWAVTRAGSYVPGATCLTLALAAQALLERYGQPARLRVGVASEGAGGVEGHAWVENEGRVVVGGGALSRYTPLTTANPARASEGGQA